MENKQFLIPPQKILKAVERRRPRTQLTELTALVGEDSAAAIMMAFTGDSIHFPTISTINRIMQEQYIQQELKGLHRGKNGYDEKVSHLTELFSLKRKTILAMRRR